MYKLLDDCPCGEQEHCKYNCYSCEDDGLCLCIDECACLIPVQETSSCCSCGSPYVGSICWKCVRERVRNNTAKGK